MKKTYRIFCEVEEILTVTVVMKNLSIKWPRDICVH